MSNIPSDISAPLVFQCERCKIIVGDSLSFHSANESLNSLSLEKACNVTHSKYIITAKEGTDVGCSYVKFFCSGCEAELGRFYCTTSRDLDGLRDKFTFSIDKITSYELGKNQLGKLPEKSVLVNGSEDVVAKEKFDEEVFKIEKVVLNLVQRMEDVESRTAELESLLNNKRARTVAF